MRLRRNFSNSLATNCGPLSVEKHERMPYRTAKLSNTIVVTCNVDVFEGATVYESFE